jgi:hypothetical protein
MNKKYQILISQDQIYQNLGVGKAEGRVKRGKVHPEKRFCLEVF